MLPPRFFVFWGVFGVTGGKHVRDVAFCNNTDPLLPKRVEVRLATGHLHPIVVLDESDASVTDVNVAAIGTRQTVRIRRA